MDSANKPIAKVQVGNVSIAVWENEIAKKDGTSFVKKTFTPQKFFKDKDGTNKNSTSFDTTELLKLDVAIKEILRTQLVKV